MSVNGFDDSKNRKEVYTKEEADALRLGTILFENDEGTKEDITLNESVEEYNQIEVHYTRKREDGKNEEYSSSKFYAPNGKKVALTTIFYSETSGTGKIDIVQVMSKVLNVNGNSISTHEEGYVNITENGIQNIESVKEKKPGIYITRIVGYK